MHNAQWLIAIAVTTFGAVFVFFAYCLPTVRALYDRQVNLYERVLVHQLLIDIDPRVAAWLAILCIVLCALVGYVLAMNIIAAIVGGALGFAIPQLVVRHLERKRYERLERQLIDAITTLASGVRAGLTLVQSMELLVMNMTGPVKQEFGQLLREYQMGLDLNQSMRNTAGRIGSPHYRLLFTAIEMHRQRGGDTGESLDRINESIRELQRLEGKLDSLTAQGRYQAWFMAAMPVVLIFMLYLINPEGVTMLFVEPLGRVFLMFATLLITFSVLWIRRIMNVEL